MKNPASSMFSSIVPIIGPALRAVCCFTWGQSPAHPSLLPHHIPQGSGLCAGSAMEMPMPAGKGVTAKIRVFGAEVRRLAYSIFHFFKETKMSAKQYVALLMLTCTGIALQAQSYLGLSVGTSKNDNHLETLWFQHQVSERFSLGLQLRYSGIGYRFVNARAIEDGSTVFAGAVLGFNIKQSEKCRLDFNLTTSYRYLSNDENPELPSSTNGLELDPNIILGLRLSDRFLFHTGAMFRAAMQFGEEPIYDEQMPVSAIVLNGFSYQKDNSAYSLRVYAGPMSGATGDTEKFFWQVSLGYQYAFGESNGQAIPFLTF